MIGKFYLSHLDDSVRAILMLRELHRIDMILYGTMAAGVFCPSMRTALHKRGIPEEWEAILGSIQQSAKLELGGDMLRELGSNEKSAREYQKVIKVEEAAFGRENPTLATLWRKLTP